MTINLHTTYTLDPNDLTYLGERNLLLKAAENNPLRLNPTDTNRLRITLDTKGRLVIGYGYDLFANQATALGDLAAAGVTLTPEQETAIQNLTGTRLSSVPAVLSGLALPSETAAANLLNLAAGRREAELSDFFTDNNFSLTQSRERAVLLSMWYQTPAYFRRGPSNTNPTNMAQALFVGDRAEVWYEIRYGSNGDNLPGIAKRRFAESQIFGLYDNPSSVQLTEAQQIYRMFTLHRTQILGYEQIYGGEILNANSDYGLTGTPDLVSSLNFTLLAAHDSLIEGLRTQYASLNNLLGSDYASKDIFLDPGRDLSSQTLDPNHAGVLNARELVNGVEQSIRNILIGEGGNDILIGGMGDDVLLGGEGLDTYRFVSGDGTDTILDDDGNGVLIREGNPLGFGVKTPEGQWLFEGTTFTQNGTELELTFSGGSDTITLKNFDFAAAQAGDYLGIRLRDTPSPADRTTGTAGSDGLFYNLQNTFAVTVEGLEGADVLSGGPSDDALFGKSEAQFAALDSEPPSSAQGDFVSGERGADLLAGSAAVDVLSGGPGSDRLYGGPGDDLIYGDFGIVGDFSSSTGPQWQIVRGANPFQVSVSGSFLAANDPVALGGADVINAGAGNDILSGGEGTDSLDGDYGDDLPSRVAADIIRLCKDFPDLQVHAVGIRLRMLPHFGPKGGRYATSQA